MRYVAQRITLGSRATIANETKGEAALLGVPEIKGIRYNEVHPDGAPSYYEFYYFSDSASGNIAILENAKSEKIIDLEWGSFGKPQRAEVVQILNLMDKVYRVFATVKRICRLQLKCNRSFSESRSLNYLTSIHFPLLPLLGRT